VTMQTPEQQAYQASHAQADTDLDRSSLHHTLGRAPTQAAPGNHVHPEFDLISDPSEFAPADHEHPEYETIEAYEVPAGKVFRLKKGVTGPVAPTIVQEVPKLISDNIQKTSAVGTDICKFNCLHDGSMYGLDQGGFEIYRVSLTTGLMTQVADVSANFSLPPQGVQRRGDNFYVLGRTGATAKIIKFDNDWIVVDSITIAVPSGTDWSLYWAGAEWMVTYVALSGGTNKFHMRFHNPDTGATTATIVTNLTAPANYRMTALYDASEFNSEFATGCLVIMDSYPATPNIYVFDSAGTRQIADEWNSVADGRGLAWDGANFLTLTLAYLYKFTNDHYTSAADGQRRVGAESYDSVNGYRSLVDFTVNYTAKKRWRAKFTFPALPEDVPAYRVYVGKQSSTLFLQATDSDSTDTVKYVTDPVLVGGTAPAGASTWPAAAPARIESADGVYYMDADGNTNFKPVVVESTSITPVAGWSVSAELRRIDSLNLMFMLLSITRTSGTMTADAQGNTADTQIFTLPAGFIPTDSQIVVAASGAKGSFNLRINGVTGTAEIVSSDPGLIINTTGTYTVNAIIRMD
jgi:hypothetical protein